MRKFPKVTSETQVSFVNEAPGVHFLNFELFFNRRWGDKEQEISTTFANRWTFFGSKGVKKIGKILTWLLCNFFLEICG